MRHVKLLLYYVAAGSFLSSKIPQLVRKSLYSLHYSIHILETTNINIMANTGIVQNIDSQHTFFIILSVHTSATLVATLITS